MYTYTSYFHEMSEKHHGNTICCQNIREKKHDAFTCWMQAKPDMLGFECFSSLQTTHQRTVTHIRTEMAGKMFTCSM